MNDTLTADISMEHVSIYLSMHHLLDALEPEIINGTFCTDEWKPVLNNYCYLMRNDTILKRVPLHEAQQHRDSGEVVTVLHLVDGIARGTRDVPSVSPAFTF